MYVAGEQVPAASGATEAVINPANGQANRHGPRRRCDRCRSCRRRRGRAFDAWAATTPSKRAELLLKLADRLDAHAEKFAQLESCNVGKPIAIARDEVPFGVDNMRFFAGAARMLEGRAAGDILPTRTSIIRRDPLGVVGSVTPWNFLSSWRSGRSVRRW